MKRFIFLATAALAGVLLAGVAVVWYALRPPAPILPVATEFTLANVTVINPGVSRSNHQWLSIENGRVRIGSNATSGANLQSAYRGMYVLPGLVDMHAHLPPGNALKLTSYSLLLDLAHGVTSIRDAADVDGTALPAQRDAVRDGYPGPRVFACGPFVSAGEQKWANTIMMRDPAEADGIAAKLKADGSHCIKAYDGLTLPMVEALRRAANQHGLMLIGHVPLQLSYEQALLPDVQHLMGIATLPPGSHRYLSDGWADVDDARLRAIVNVTKQHGIANTPTLVLGQQLLHLENYAAIKDGVDVRLAPRLFRDVVWSPTIGLPTYRGMTAADFENLRIAQQKKLKLVRWLYEAGATLYLGTDVQQPFVIPGLSLQQEMRLFAEAGIPLESIWRMATAQSGAALGLPRLGTVAQDAPADLLIFRDDPTQDLNALNSLEAVVSQGRLYSKQAIDAKIAQYQKHYDGVVFDRVSVMLAEIALRKTAAAPREQR